MVNSTSANAINVNGFSSPINNAIYQNFVSILKKGVNENTNTNLNINTKVNNLPKKFKIIDNQVDFVNLAQSNINIIKNTVNTNNKTINSISNSPLTSSLSRTKKYNNRRLNFEVLTRIFIFAEDPKAFSLVCRQWYYVSKETSSKLLWFINRIQKETLCIYLFTHPIYHVHFDANFLKIVLKRGAQLDLHFLEQAIPILLKNKNGITNREELGIPLVSYYNPILKGTQSSSNSSYNDNNMVKKHILNENEKDIYKYFNNDVYKNDLNIFYNDINNTKKYQYHYSSTLLPIFLYLYQKSKKQYLGLVEDINNSLKDELNSSTANEENSTFLIENYQPIISINETINQFLNDYKNDTMIPKAILDSMLTSNTKTLERYDTIIKTITHFYNEIKNNTVVLPILKNYLHHLVYDFHFIPYNIVQKPYNSKQIRTVLQFMEVVWLLEPEIIFTWIKWGWGDADGQIPLILFATYYDCKSLQEERNHNQSIRQILQQVAAEEEELARRETEAMASDHHHYHHHSSHNHHTQNTNMVPSGDNDIISRINTSQYRLLDYMMDQKLKISNDTLYFIMGSNAFNCSCYNMLGHSSESPCTLKNIIKYWKKSNDKESKINVVHKLAYNAWSRKDGVGLYKMEYYLKCFNSEGETLLNINEFIIEMIMMDPSVIFKQDMLGWIINHSSSPHVKKIILYTLFMALPKDPQRIHMVKLILNFVGDIDLKAIELLKAIDKDHSVWEQLYSILIIHLYRRYVRRRINLDAELCTAWADLFIGLNPHRFMLSSVQTRFQDELFARLEVA